MNEKHRRNPHHTNLTAVAGKTYTDREWKIPDFQTLRERQNATHRTMDANTDTISMMGRTYIMQLDNGGKIHQLYVSKGKKIDPPTLKFVRQRKT